MKCSVDRQDLLVLFSGVRSHRRVGLDQSPPAHEIDVVHVGRDMCPLSPTTQINAGATPMFGVFVTGQGNVAFDPAGHRIFVRFRSGDVIRGATSVGVDPGSTVAARRVRVCGRSETQRAAD